MNSIVMSKFQPVGQAMVIVITLLYMVSTTNFALNWLYTCSIFVSHGQSIWTKHLFYNTPRAVEILGSGATTTVCTILADFTIVCDTPLRISTTGSSCLLNCRFGVVGRFVENGG